MIFKKKEKNGGDDDSFDVEGKREKVKKNLCAVNNRVVIFSSKEGVGKTAVAVNLSYLWSGWASVWVCWMRT